MLKYGEINPLNVFGLRRLDHRPPHFESVTFNISTAEKHITDWIYENLSGRFWLGDVYVESSETSLALTKVKCAAFEIHSEASFFALTLDQINTYSGQYL